MKGKNVKESVEKIEGKREKKKEINVFCRDCEFYNKDSEREFWRESGPIYSETGERTVILEIRGICTCETVKAHGHLVKMDNPRECAGYKKTEEKETKKQNNEDKTAPHEYYGPPLDIVEESELQKGKKKRLKSGAKVTVTDPTNGEVKTFEKKRRKLVLVKS